MADPRSPLTPLVSGPLGDDGPLGSTAVELDRGDCDVDDLDEVDRLDLSRPGSPTRCRARPAAASATAKVGLRRGAGPRRRDDGGRGRPRPSPTTAWAGPTPPSWWPTSSPRNPRARGSPSSKRGAPAIAGDGEETLADLVPEPVTLALVQLRPGLRDFYVWFQARRAGRPVAEPRPTTLAGSELVGAVGRLLQQERDPERSAGLLGRPPAAPGPPVRSSPGADLDDLVTAAERAGADPDRLRAILYELVSDGDALTTLARDIDATRREILT